MGYIDTATITSGGSGYTSPNSQQLLVKELVQLQFVQWQMVQSSIAITRTAEVDMIKAQI